VRNPKAIGELSEACITAALLRRGFAVLHPFGNNQRYDLVVDDGGRFLRIQCKTGRLRDGVIVFPTTSRSGGTRRRTYHGEADMFAVYCPDTDKSYLVPVAAVGRSMAHLRVAPARNKQRCEIRYAREFEL
jgi:hypothetical protein